MTTETWRLGKGEPLWIFDGLLFVAEAGTQEYADRIIADHNAAAELAAARTALEHATWMNRWQFDEHRTDGNGELKDDAFCRCDWCKTYRDTRDEDRAALHKAQEIR